MMIVTGQSNYPEKYILAPDTSKIWCKKRNESSAILFLELVEKEKVNAPYDHPLQYSYYTTVVNKYQVILEDKNSYGKFIIPDSIPSKYIDEVRMAMILEDVYY